MTQNLVGTDVFEARAILVGERIDLRAWDKTDVLDTAPLTIAVRGGGIAVLARFGAVVLLGVLPADEAAFLERIRPLVLHPYPAPEIERIETRIDPSVREGTRGGVIYLESASLEKLQLIADILSKSVVLGLYETRIAHNFDRIEPLATELEQTGRIPGVARDLLKHIGAMLISEHRMVGRAEVSEKPELLWEHPSLEGLFVRLEDEFEIRERHTAIERKLNLITHTASTLLELLHNRHSLRVEWYIVFLIVAEIALSLFAMF